MHIILNQMTKIHSLASLFKIVCKNNNIEITKVDDLSNINNQKHEKADHCHNSNLAHAWLKLIIYLNWLKDIFNKEKSCEFRNNAIDMGTNTFTNISCLCKIIKFMKFALYKIIMVLLNKNTQWFHNFVWHSEMLSL